MKTLLNPRKLPRLTLVLGVAGYCLRHLYYAAAMDHKGLLVPHPLGWALGAVTAAALLLIIAGVLRWNREPLLPMWPLAWSLPSYMMVMGSSSLVLDGLFSVSGLLLVRNILALLSAASVLATLFLRKKEKPVPFPLYGILCIFFAVHMVSCYQSWSSNPQIQDYVFTLMASVGLMLYTYQKTAAAVGFRKEKRTLAIGLLTSFFCFVALSGTDFPVLYLCSGYWVLTDLPQAVFEEAPVQENQQDETI